MLNLMAVKNCMHHITMCAATLSGSLFSQGNHSYHPFIVNPKRWELCVRDSQRGERNFQHWNHVQKQTKELAIDTAEKKNSQKTKKQKTPLQGI